MQSIYIPGRNQVKLAAYLFWPEGDCKYIIIICHGFRGAKENGGRIFTFAQRLNSLGLGALAFDFSGSGASEGEFADVSLSSQVDDLEHVINYVEHYYNIPIILLGRSFGGSTVLAKGGTADERVKGYIFWSTPFKLNETFSSLINEFSRASNAIVEINDTTGSFKLKSSFIEDFANHNMAFNASRIASSPVLIIHGTADEVVDPDNALCLYKNCNNAELHIIAAADHRFTNNIAERENITLNWLQKTFLY